MILRRLTENIRKQNWTGIALEFVLVVVGVFLGISAANWNQERQHRAETERLLGQLRTELADFGPFIDTLDDYYGSAGRFADRALAGWRRDPSISDEQFVIAAYQASQITAVGTNPVVWAEIFGADNLRNIEDLNLRRSLARIMTFDYDLVNLRSVSTRYREEVRKVIPDAIQAAIRARCGDQPHPLSVGLFVLPKDCPLDLPDGEAAQAAAALRARTDLPQELHWHRAAVANQLANANTLKVQTEDVTRLLVQ